MAQSQSTVSLTPKPLIVSIPHTGTRFLKERLDVEEHIHTNTAWDTVWERVQGRHLIVPLRNPTAVWRSWCRRRDDGEVFRWAPHFFASYYVMHTLDMMCDIDYICIDKQDDGRIADWSKVGDDDGSHAKWRLHQVDLRVLFKLPFVNRHYPTWGAQ